MARAGLVSTLLVTVAVVMVRAQERIPAGPPPDGPTFEVASIKRVTGLQVDAGRQPNRAARAVAAGRQRAPACGMSMSGNVIRLGGMPLATLARSISGVAGRPVVDRTGLAGNYELTLLFSGRPTGAVDEPPSIFTAVQEQLGLKLVPDRAPLKVLVVDHIERPTED